MKNSITFLFIVVGFVLITPQSALAGSVISITKEGVASFTEAKVMQLVGGTIFARLYWGEAYIRFTIKTDSRTKFYRGTGEVTTISEIVEGNLLDVTGELESGSNTLTLITSSIKNSSVQKQQTNASGKVVSVDLGLRKFILDSKVLGVININVKPETSFVKGNRTLDLEHFFVGDMVTKVSGDYDLSTKTLVADSVLTYVDPAYYKAKNFEGVLQVVSGVSVPTSLRVMVGKTSYTVNLREKTSILKKNRSAGSLNRFVVGDNLRIYGSIVEVDEPIIDAGIVRNMSL
ncbi:MAG: hypothetical protein EXS47_01330 [Candidatus Zambryskibacteria bacterium]|nr:hypothetical protein [Candidatus Zambryskibacteria bacterium]